MGVFGIFIGHALGKKRERDNRNYHALVPIKEKLYSALDNKRGYVSHEAPTDSDINRACARLSKKRAKLLAPYFTEYSDSQKYCLRTDEWGSPSFTSEQLSRYRSAAEKLLHNL